MALAPHKQAEVDSRSRAVMLVEATKPFGWDAAHFVEWATVTEMLRAVELKPPASILDVGCGAGWGTLFLAEAGYDAFGIDLVPANVQVARDRAARWGSPARFEVGDMDDLQPGGQLDGALLLDALHHSYQQAAVVAGIARRLRRGGWLLLGEPTWLHRISPHARSASHDRGWAERGLTVRRLRRDLRAAGFDELRRFFQPTRPYEGRLRGFVWQALRLVGANVAMAPQAHLWLAARRG